MSSSIKTIFFLILLVLVAMGAYAIGKSMRASLEMESTVNACPAVMADIIESSKGNVYEMGDEEEYVEPETYYLVAYSVNQDDISEPAFDDSIPMVLRDDQRNVDLQEETWEIFAALIPPEDRWMIAEYNTFT